MTARRATLQRRQALQHKDTVALMGTQKEARWGDPATPKALQQEILRDRLRPGLHVMFVGINPGVRSALTGHHFAGFSNRFWKLLYDSRLVPEPITFADDDRLPDWGYGITNIVARATPGIDGLEPHEFAEGRLRLRRKILRHRPRVVAFVGVTVFRAMFPAHRGPVPLGPRPEQIGASAVFVLPNPSGRNANYSYAEMLDAYRELARMPSRQLR